MERAVRTVIETKQDSPPDARCEGPEIHEFADCSCTGETLLHNPCCNKGTAFSMTERKKVGLRGLLPPKKENISLQVERVMQQLRAEENRPLEKYLVLQQLSQTNRVLYYRVISENIKELLPIIYTPTVGEACTKFDIIFRSTSGMYFSAFEDKSHFRSMLDNWPHSQVDIIVVTDGGRILGLGDLGTNGMGIPIGKIDLYVVAGGFNPNKALPVCLDVGTNRVELLEDKFYLGSKQGRLKGEAHMEVIEEFCSAVQDKWPSCVIQFEDFQTEPAYAILRRMRDRFLCFNDDIQGTGGVILAGLLNGMKIQETQLKDARLLFFGAGSAACGVADAVVAYLQSEQGLSEEDSLQGIYMLDRNGLLTDSREDVEAFPQFKKRYSRRDDTPNIKTLIEIIEYVKPHALLGLSGAGPAFGREVIEKVCEHCPTPLIFPLSNPTSKAEITAEDAYSFSKGKCIFAAGSPFDPVEYGGKTFYPGQGNNVFVFPGVGFASSIVQASKIPDEFFVEAAKVLSEYVTEEEIVQGKVYPSLENLQDISARIAIRVATKAYEMNIAALEKPKNLDAFVREKMLRPNYDVY